MTQFYKPDLGTNPDDPFARDGMVNLSDVAIGSI